MTFNGSGVLVVGLGASGLDGLCAASSLLGDDLSALVVSSKEDLKQAETCGASSIFYIEKQPDIPYDDYLNTIFSYVTSVAPRVVVLKTSRREHAIAARLASKLKISLIPNVSRIWIEDGCVHAEHMVYGGSAFRIERCKQATCVVTLVESGLSEVEPSAVCQNISEVTFVEPPRRSRLIETKSRVSEQVDLASAKRVVSIGRGLAKQEDLKLVEDFAASIDAEVGCTRPIAEGMGWMSKERYIGVSGAMLNADVFIAVGLSGQVQHMVGASNSKSIFAVNKDKNAMIFKRSDYGIVGDLYKILPKVVELLSSR